MKTIVACIISAIILIAGQSLLAGEPTVKSFKAPAASSGVAKPAVYPDLAIDGFGVIDRLTDRAVIINDKLFPLDDPVAYRRENGSPADKSDFTVGTVVWYVLDYQDVVTELWKKEK